MISRFSRTRLSLFYKFSTVGSGPQGTKGSVYFGMHDSYGVYVDQENEGSTHHRKNPEVVKKPEGMPPREKQKKEAPKSTKNPEVDKKGKEKGVYDTPDKRETERPNPETVPNVPEAGIAFDSINTTYTSV